MLNVDQPTKLKLLKEPLQLLLKDKSIEVSQHIYNKITTITELLAHDKPEVIKKNNKIK